MKNWLDSWSNKLVVNGLYFTWWPVTKQHCRHLYCHFSCLTSLSVTWRMWQSAPSSGLQLTTNWRDQSISSRAGLPLRASQTGWKDGPVLWTSKKRVTVIHTTAAKLQSLRAGSCTPWQGKDFCFVPFRMHLMRTKIRLSTPCSSVAENLAKPSYCQTAFQVTPWSFH